MRNLVYHNCVNLRMHLPRGMQTFSTAVLQNPKCMLLDADDAVHR